MSNKNEVVIENAPAQTSGGYMAIIEKLAENPTMQSVEVMERMMAMQERWVAQQDEREFNLSMSRISKKLANVRIEKKRSVGYAVDKNDLSKGTKEAFKYAALEDIDKILRPILDEEGVSLYYDIEASTIPGWHTVVAYATKGLHSRSSRIQMPLDVSGGKGNAQAMGSTQTYGMRRATCALFNIVIVGEDDDGAGGAITDEQAEQIKKGLKETGLDVAKFLKNLKVETVEEIRVRDHGRAVTAIDAKRWQKLQDEKKKEVKNANPA